MAIDIYRGTEQTGRVDMRDPEVSIKYLIKATGDDKFAETAIEDAMEAEAPATYSGLGQRSIGITELGNGVYEAIATYRLLEGSPLPALSGTSPIPPPGQPGGPPPAPAVGDALDETYSFQTSGGTQHITLSLETVSRTKIDQGFAPNWRGAIGVNTAGRDPLGCDIFVGRLEFTMTKEIPAIDLAYVKVLAALTGTVNKTSFYHFPAGSVLFLGATGQTKGPQGTGGVGGWVVTYHFAVAENLEVGDPQLVIVPESSPGEGDGLVVPGKDGWDYLWVQFAPDTDEGQLGRRPLNAYVERVYPRTDFARLGIG